MTETKNIKVKSEIALIVGVELQSAHHWPEQGAVLNLENLPEPDFSRSYLPGDFNELVNNLVSFGESLRNRYPNRENFYEIKIRVKS